MQGGEELLGGTPITVIFSYSFFLFLGWVTLGVDQGVVLIMGRFGLVLFWFEFGLLNNKEINILSILYSSKIKCLHLLFFHGTLKVLTVLLNGLAVFTF